MQVLYTAHASAEGGRNGTSKTTDGKFSFEMESPGTNKKSGVTTNPEELFAIGYAACFCGAVEFVAKQTKADITGIKVDSDVSLQKGDDGFSIGVAMNVTIPELDKETARKIVATAHHKVCPYSKATRGNVDVKLTLNGEELNDAELQKLAA